MEDHRTVKEKIQKVSFAKIVKGVKELAINFFRQPEITLLDSVKEQNKIIQFSIAALYVAVTLILFTIMGCTKSIGFPKSFGYTILFLLVIVGLKAAYASAIYLFTKKLNQGMSYLSMLGLFSITFTLDLVFSILTFIFVAASSIELTVAVFLLWIAMEAVLSFFTTSLFYAGNLRVSFYVTLLLQTILLVLVALFMRLAVSNLFSGMVNNFMYGIGY